MGFLDEINKVTLEDEQRAMLIASYTDDVGPVQAKVAELTNANDAATQAIKERDAEIQRVKAKNWDLTMNNPGIPADKITDPNASTDTVVRSGKALFDKYKK
jgi:peptidoglycan hydrolase CwlO-like protein